MFTRKIKILLLILFVALNEIAGNGGLGNYYFTTVSGDAGLSQNDVKTILQDSWGFMWFGSRNRLNRYDGKSIKVFDCNDPLLEKQNNNINSLFEGKDKKLWVGTNEGVFIFDPLSETFSFFNVTTANGEHIHNWIADIQEDSSGNIWIVVPGQGLFRYHPSTTTLHYYEFSNHLPPHQGKPQAICIEKNGRVWIGTNGDGVFLYNRNTDNFTRMLGDRDGDSLTGDHIYTLCDYGEELVIGIHEGKLRKLHKLKNTLSDVAAPEVHYKIIRHVVCYEDELWVGTEDGVFIINELANKVLHLHEDPMSEFALSDNMVEKIYRDRENGIWIGTYFGGVNYLPKRDFVFEQYIPLSNSNSISSKRIRELKEDTKGNIWIGTEDAGLCMFHPKTGEFRRIERGVSSESVYRKCLGLSVVGEDEVWAGFFKNGLDVIQVSNLQVKHYSDQQLGLNEASITSILEDRFGNVWMGNAWGLFKGKKGSTVFTPVEGMESVYVYDIFEDTDGFIWIATMGSGVYRYSVKDNSVSHFWHDSKNPFSLSSNSVSSITEDSRGYIWFSTDRGGICRYDRNKDEFNTFSLTDGLPDDVAYKILEDKENNLWFGTNKGLVKFNPDSRQVRVYTKNDGLPGDQFNYKSALVTRSGKFYFGGLNGLIAFHPAEIKDNDFISPVFITKLTSFNKEVELHISGSPLEKSIIHTRDLKLNYSFSNIGFDFAALSYVAPQANQYAYKMEGFEEDWTYVDHTQRASYAKLPPGKYVFRVKASNNDGIWNEEGAGIYIEILPPWWRSRIAYVLYLIVILALILYTIKWYLQRVEKRNQAKNHLFRIEQEKELYNAKLDFFTNVAHEIRTPLSLINGPLESMQEMEITDPEIEKSVGIMRKNTDRLLNLINQLLDFRKVDSNNMTLNFSMLDISAFLKDMVAQFEPVVTRNKKSVQLYLPYEEVVAAVDRNEFTKILHNLLSNAVKYAEKQIRIYLSMDKSDFKIEVKSDGELIPHNLQEKIFEPFYQLDKDRQSASGSGIGLSLVRSLVELHRGEVYLDTLSGFNSFVLKLPLHQENVVEILSDQSNVQEEFIVNEEVLKQGKNNFEVVLVVEDNEEMLSFIADRLRDVFVVETARNGVEAIKLLGEKSVDIIVSDLMMPEMDGFELCRELKQNIEYSHIPVVLLTAKNDLTSKIQGLETGAEAYIEKPFSFNYLISQLTTLLNNRRREREAFMQKPFLPVQQIGMSKTDEKFLDAVIEIIKENLTEADFTIDDIADKLFMSRSSLNRKIKSLTELTPTDFIRLIRLKKAAELIQTGDYRVGEICYMVGINSSSYFIRLFQKQFGMTPREFAKQQRGNS